MVRALIPRRALLALALLPVGLQEHARALGRLPFGGKLRLSLPFALRRLDPHDLRDPLAALLAPALFDSLFAPGGTGIAYPTLAAAPVETVGSALGVRLRPGLLDSTGRALSARDLAFSLERAALGAARPLLGPFGPPVRDRRDPDRVLFPRGTAAALENALASSFVAVLPRSFDPTRPAGTGAFRAIIEGGRLRLVRNEHAARGAAFLDAVEVDPAPDLSHALRRFEAGEVDLGWLGRGLHRVRAGAEMFRSPALGWLVLHSGKRLGAWGAPGVAQQLVLGLDAARVEGLGVRLPPTTLSGARYEGPPAELLTRGDSPHLVAVADTLAQLFGPAVRVRREAPEVVERVRALGDFDFLLELVRSPGPSRDQRYLTLLGVASAVSAAQPPTLPASVQGRELELYATRATRTAVVGEFAVVAGRVPGFRELESWDLGAVWRS